MKMRIESTGTSLQGKELGSVKHAVFASKECLKNSSHRKDEVEYLINTGIYRDQHIVEPAMASFVQDELKMNRDFRGKPTLSFDLANGGCGVLNALHLLESMMKSREIRTGLVVSSEAPFDAKLHQNYKYVPTGGAIVVDVSPSDERGFGSFVFKTFDEYEEKYGAVISLKVKRGEIIIKQQKDLEDIYVNCASEVFQELLKKENLTVDDIDYVIPSQVSNGFIDSLGKSTGMAKEKMVNILHVTGGDPFTTSPIIGYHYLARKNLLEKGKKVVFVTAGSGVTAGAAVYYC